VLINAGTAGGFKAMGGAVGDVYLATAGPSHTSSLFSSTWAVLPLKPLKLSRLMPQTCSSTRTNDTSKMLPVS
jgi:hypothetical protein